MRRLPAIGIGLVLGICTIILHSLLSEQKGNELLSFALVIIGAVYFGFAFVSKRLITKVIEISTASVFVVMGLFGLWFSPWILVAGLFLHGIWDILHHNSPTLAKIPNWYIPLCAVYDWMMALYLTFIL